MAVHANSVLPQATTPQVSSLSASGAAKLGEVMAQGAALNQWRVTVLHTHLSLRHTNYDILYAFLAPTPMPNSETCIKHLLLAFSSPYFNFASPSLLYVCTQILVSTSASGEIQIKMIENRKVFVIFLEVTRFLWRIIQFSFVLLSCNYLLCFSLSPQ